MNMFNKLLIIALLGALSCQGTGDVKIETEQGIGQIQRKTIALKDTIPTSSRNSRIMVDRSRNIEEIEAKFPFDIPLEQPDEKVVLSNEVMTKNGKPTVVLFWLTTCYPCRIEMSAIQKKYDSWKSEVDFNIVAISTDWDKNFEQFAKMSLEQGWPWLAYRDKDREFRKVLPGGLNGLPQTFIFDKNGSIVYHSRKYRQGDEDKLFQAIKDAAKT